MHVTSHANSVPASTSFIFSLACARKALAAAGVLGVVGLLGLLELFGLTGVFGRVEFWVIGVIWVTRVFGRVQLMGY